MRNVMHVKGVVHFGPRDGFGPNCNPASATCTGVVRRVLVMIISGQGRRFGTTLGTGVIFLFPS